MDSEKIYLELLSQHLNLCEQVRLAKSKKNNRKVKKYINEVNETVEAYKLDKQELKSLFKINNYWQSFIANVKESSYITENIEKITPFELAKALNFKHWKGIISVMVIVISSFFLLGKYITSYSQQINLQRERYKVQYLEDILRKRNEELDNEKLLSNNDEIIRRLRNQCDLLNLLLQLATSPQSEENNKIEILRKLVALLKIMELVNDVIIKREYGSHDIWIELPLLGERFIITDFFYLNESDECID